MTGLEILIELSRDAGRLHAQLERQLREAIRAGRLSAHAPLPTTRALAGQLGVSRGVVVEAYAQLKSEGYLEARPGAGTRVAIAARTSQSSPAPTASPAAPAYDFHPGHPDLSQFPRAAWARSLRAALKDAAHSEMGYGDVRGVVALRRSLAYYLGRVRGTVAEPEHILISTGHTQAITLTLRALARQGAKRVAVEDPGFVVDRALITHLGLETVPIPVDEHGIDTEHLGETGADVVLVTPAHQFPTGVVLSPPRRRALIEWAKANETLIIEDDYDAEYRYDRQPVGALQGLAPDHVIYSGTTSKTLAPGLRLAWSILPEQIRGAVAAEKAMDDQGTPTLEQLTLAVFLDNGELDRHVRRMRPHYEQRRHALTRAVARHLPDTRLQGIPAGLHALLHLPAGVKEHDLLGALFADGVAVQGLSSAYHDQRRAPPGLILGYGNQPPATIEQGIRRIATIRQRIQSP